MTTSFRRNWMLFPFAVATIALLIALPAYACTTMGGQTYIDTAFGPGAPVGGGSFTAHANGLTQVSGNDAEYFLMQDPNGNYCHVGALKISSGLGRGASNPWNTGSITGTLDSTVGDNGDGSGTYFICVSNYTNSAWPQELQVY